MTIKKLPPYAKAINDARRNGMVPARGCLGHIAIGFEWRRNIVPDFPVVVVPPEREPAAFEWRVAAGPDVFIMHSDRDIPHLHALCSALFAANAHDVQTFNMNRVCRGEPRAWLRLIPLWKKQPCQSQNSI